MQDNEGRWELDSQISRSLLISEGIWVWIQDKSKSTSEEAIYKESSQEKKK